MDEEGCCSKKRPAAREQRDDEWQAVAKAYGSLSSVSRPLLAQTAEQFIKDPAFREYVRRYIHPPQHKVEQKIFRFMDLPIELRIMIAEFVLYQPNGLHWEWTSFDPDPRIGFFQYGYSTSSCDDLGLVSRQLREETKDIVFKVNTLVFTDELAKSYSDADHSVANSLNAFRHFAKYSCPASLSAVNSIRLVARFMAYNGQILARIISQCYQLVNDFPKIDISFTDMRWAVHHLHKIPEQYEHFMIVGRRAQRALSQAPHKYERTWRIWPTIENDEIEFLQKRLSAEDFQLASGWIKEGI